MSSPKHKLARAKSRLLKQLSGGFSRAIFASPQAASAAESGTIEAQEVIEGPGAQALDAPTLAHLFDQANDAADRGLVKHSWILPKGEQLSVDARHGFLKKRAVDPARIDKVMAGKDRALRPDTSAALLQALGIMKADGSIPAKRAKKYKQVNHLVELTRPTLAHLDHDKALRIVDLACGNAYLSFVLAESLRLAGREFDLLGVDVREDLVARCRERAASLDWPQLRFERATIESVDRAQLEGADLLLALHACDTASDAAIVAGLEGGVAAMWIVPCCHAQVAAQLLDQPQSQSPLPFAALRDEGLLRRAHAESLTDAIRVEVLRACGYEVALVEFVSSEHTPKNLLIRAHRSARSIKRGAPLTDPECQRRLAQVRSRALALGIEPALVQALA